ncbi:FG-GAP-like repeat-containing protein [Cellulosimicrobium sp. NPDC057127]|uniref:FG-GAP-like repeat-containing protein n=1 Tax=Cellulosimicrobium sp. NPDC057127 TaxID=3346026 RepID=UPI003642075B
MSKIRMPSAPAPRRWLPAAVVLSMAVVGLPATVATAAPSEPEPVEADVQEVALETTPASELSTDAGEAPFPADEPALGGSTSNRFFETEVVLSGSATSSGLALVGVTWAAGTDSDDTEVSVRTRSDETWSDWESIEVERLREEDSAEAGGGPAGAAARGGTEPVVVGEVDEIEVALRGSSTPEDPLLVVIDPGSAPSDAAPAAPVEVPVPGTDEPTEDPADDIAGGEAATAGLPADLDLGDVVLTSRDVTTATTTVDTETPAAAAVASALTAAKPAIYSRAQWGADESIMIWKPQVGRVNGAVVHHTAGSNSYTSAQVPAVIRGIYTYHAQSRGWGDIGYNFLIDKFGRIWEGRAGGIDRAIVGAHAAGVNSQAFGLSLMGNYDQATVPAAAMDAMSRLIAWKLSLHGVRANGTASIGGRTMAAVVGHRDVGQTSCPGANFYPRLGELRASASRLQSVHRSAQYSRDLTGDSMSDLVLSRGGVTSVLTRVGWQWSARVLEGSGWNTGQPLEAGDWDGDGRGDLMLLDDDGGLWFYKRSSTGGFERKQKIGWGWNSMDVVIGGHDWDGDRHPDLLARSAADGSLWLYPNDGARGFGRARQIGVGWAGMSAITMIGDVGAGRPALIARSGDGRLHTYIGDGRGGFSSTISHGRGWDAMTDLLGVGDVTSDRSADLMARDGSGRLWVYPGDGTGRFTSRYQVGHGWQSFAGLISGKAAGGSVAVYGWTPDGALYHYPYVPNENLEKVVLTGIAADSAQTSAIAAGDWDGDGIDDLMSTRSNGSLLLHRGGRNGTFAAGGTQIGNGWGVMSQIIGVPDWSGDGRPALVALERGQGRIWLYPGDGRGGFGTRVLLTSDARGVDLIVNAGTSTGRGLNLLTRESGTLYLREGQGARGLGAPRRIGPGWGAARAIVGMGDITADGRPDIILVDPDGDLLLYLGDGSGGYQSPRPAGRAPAGSTVS